MPIKIQDNSNKLTFTKLIVAIQVIIFLNGCATSTLWQEQSDRYIKKDKVVKNVTADIRISPDNKKLHIIYYVDQKPQCMAFTPKSEKSIVGLNKFVNSKANIKITSLSIEQTRLIIKCDKSGGSSPLHDTDEIKLQMAFIVPKESIEGEGLLRSSVHSFEVDQNTGNASLLMFGNEFILDQDNKSTDQMIRLDGNDKACKESLSWVQLLPLEKNIATLSITDDSLRKGYELTGNGVAYFLRVLATPFTVVFDVVTFPIQIFLADKYLKF